MGTWRRIIMVDFLDIPKVIDSTIKGENAKNTRALKRLVTKIDAELEVEVPTLKPDWTKFSIHLRHISYDVPTPASLREYYETEKHYPRVVVELKTERDASVAGEHLNLKMTFHNDHGACPVGAD
jgi:hypothetical protein